MEHYEKYGVKQLRLPTVDTAAPTLEQVHQVRHSSIEGGSIDRLVDRRTYQLNRFVVSTPQGVAFIEAFLENDPDRRVFIHCKGGRYVE